jgi:MFS family permease
MVPVLGYAGAVMALTGTLAIPLLPVLPEELGTSITAASWVASVTLVAGGVSTPVAGRIGDMYGKRRVILASLVLAVVGSCISALAGSLAVLLVGRLLQGLAFGVIPLALGILRDELDPDRLGRGVAVLSAFTLGIGTGLGPVSTGWVVDTLGWRAVFWAVAAMGAVAVLLVLVVVEESDVRAPARFDWPGTAGLSAAVVLLLLVVTRGGEWGWTSPVILSLLAGAVVVAAGWVRWERGRESPLVDLEVTLRRPVLVTHVAGVMCGFAAFSQFILAVTIVPLPVASGFGLGRSMLVAGLTQVPAAVLIVASAPVAAAIVARWGTRVLLQTGGGVVAVGFGFGILLHDELWHVSVSAAAVCLGVGLTYCSLPLLLMANVGVSGTAAANGVNNLARIIGSVTAAAVASAVLAASVRDVGGEALPAHWAVVSVYVLGLLAAVGATVLALALPRHRRRTGVGAST